MSWGGLGLLLTRWAQGDGERAKRNAACLDFRNGLPCVLDEVTRPLVCLHTRPVMFHTCEQSLGVVFSG